MGSGKVQVQTVRKNSGLFDEFFISNLCQDPEFELHNAWRTGFATLQALSRMTSEVKASTVFGYGTIALRIRWASILCHIRSFQGIYCHRLRKMRQGAGLMPEDGASEASQLWQ
jgi:ornithine cyclodeaminase/alanine dehydrogenase-like protein (mu-crystallin family)